MRDIIEEALSEHVRDSKNVESIWNVAFVNNDMIRGTIKSLGRGNYALVNPHGLVYFCAEKVIYLYPVIDRLP